jgi:hypothetical protein
MRTDRKLHTWSCVGALVLYLLPIWASAISVTVSVERVAFCGQPVGILSAEVTGGEGAFTYDWARGEGGSYVPYCSDCGPLQENLSAGEYRVTVTDALLDQAVGYATLTAYGPEYFLDPNSIQAIYNWPYVAGGELPYISIHPTWGSPVTGYDNLYIEVDNAIQWPETNLYIGGDRWWFRPQTTTGGAFTITVEYNGQQCVFDVPYTLPQPASVPPEMAVLEVEGSCSNVATGRATITVSNTVCAMYDMDPGVAPSPWSFLIWKDGPHYQAMGYPSGEPWQQPDFNYLSVTQSTTAFQLEGLPPGTHNFFASPYGFFY